MKNILYPILCSMIVICTFEPVHSQSADLKVEMISELILKEGPDHPDYLITNVRAIQVDSDHNIYIAEGEQNTIYKFEEDGTFVKTIGRQGRGPGEFEEIRLFKIRRDTLFVFTRGTASLILYDTDGKLLGSVVSPSWTSLDMEPTDFGYIVNLNSEYYSDLNKPFLGSYDRNLKRINTSEIRFKDLYEETPDMITGKIAGSSPVELLHLEDDRLLMAPGMYNGRIFEMTFDKAAREWKQASVLESFPRENYYTELDQNADVKIIDQVMIDSERGMLVLRVHSRSYGLFRLSDGKILHFVLRDNGKAREYGVEVFSEDYRYLGYEVLAANENPENGENYYQSRVFAKNSKDSFYLYKTSPDGGYQTEVFSLKISY